VDSLVERLLFFAFAALCAVAASLLLRDWLRRQDWIRAEAVFVAFGRDANEWIFELPSPTGPVRVTVPAFGDEDIAAGDTRTLHHPPGQPDRARHGSANSQLLGSMVAAVLAVLGVAAGVGWI
jgi:hypothetical protein